MLSTIKIFSYYLHKITTATTTIPIITITTIITIVVTITIIATIITIVIKVGTGPTLASKLTMDFLAWAFIASLVVLAVQPSVMVMIMMIMIDGVLDAY